MLNILDEFEGKNIIITGATGLIGTRMITMLLDNIDQCQIFAIGRNKDKLKKTFSSYLSDKRLILIAHDIINKFNIDFKNIDYLFHLAGPQEQNVIINHPLEVISANLSGLINCFDYLHNQKSNSGYSGKLIVFSSLKIYGEPSAKNVRLVNEIDTEVTSNLDNNMTVYSEAKRMAEVIARSYQNTFDIDYVICRLSTVYGPSKNPTNTAFFEFIEKSKNGGVITIRDKFGPKRDNIYLDDAVTGVFFAAAKGKSGEAYNVSSNGELNNFLSVSEISLLISKISNDVLHNQNLVTVKFEKKTVNNQDWGIILNNHKLKSLGWNVNYSYSDGLKAIFRKIKNKKH